MNWINSNKKKKEKNISIFLTINFSELTSFLKKRNLKKLAKLIFTYSIENTLIWKIFWMNKCLKTCLFYWSWTWVSPLKSLTNLLSGLHTSIIKLCLLLWIYRMWKLGTKWTIISICFFKKINKLSTKKK